MGSSRRIALPLAIALHILLLVLLSRQSVLMRPVQTASRSLTVQLIPLLQAKPPVPAQLPSSREETASSSNQKKHSASRIPVQAASAPANPAPVAEAPNANESDNKPALNDPAALVKSYSYENSKSDLQKAIESHGGTVALTKGQYDDFHKQMDFATIPDCMRPDGLKHDPPKIGPIAIGGLPALLFLAHAAATGKCKLPGN